MIVVSDTTPLSELAKVGKLNILEDTYVKIWIPQEVYDEVTAGSHSAIRRVALSRGLPVIGTIGMLLLAKQRGLIDSVKVLLDDLIDAGKCISPQLYEEVLGLANEEK